MERNPIPILHNLTLEQKLGQLLCLGWQGANAAEARTLNGHAGAIVDEMQAGGIILMSRNLDTPAKTRGLVRDLQTRSQIPCFIAVDQEGGVVNRFGKPFHQFPGNMALGAIPEDRADDLAYRQAEAMARELTAVGVNWNFAPVLDVNNNADNPIIGVRSFGEDPDRVARLGTAMIRGFQQSGLLACAKHFPGHGDTATDSHLDLPTVPGDRDRLDAIELKPFRAAIAAGVGAIMTTHILFPALDAKRPATLSPHILTGLLRAELGYDGLVITDCLEMDAIAGTVGTANGAVQAIKAGADMALICHTLKVQREAFAALKRAVETGELSMSRIDEAVQRNLAAKALYAAPPSGFDAKPWNDPETSALERDISRASFTVARTSARAPFPIEPNAPVTLISAHPKLHDIEAALVRHGVMADRIQVHSIPAAFPKPAQDGFPATAAHEGLVLMATAPPEAWTNPVIDQEGQARFVRELHAVCGDRLAVVALREPYDLRRFPEVENYFCTYGYRPCSLDALAAALVGEYQPAGKLPVTIPDLD